VIDNVDFDGFLADVADGDIFRNAVLFKPDGK
jgi:hypothetical protein